MKLRGGGGGGAGNAVGTNLMSCGSYDQSSISLHKFNAFPASQDFCPLLSLLFSKFVSLYHKQYEARSDCSFGSSQIWVNIVCSHEKI